MNAKKFIIAASLVFALNSSVYAQDISVNLNGNTVSFPNQQPVVVNGRTLIPLRGVFDALGYDIAWNGNTKTVTLTKGRDTITVTIGAKFYYLNGAPYNTDVPAQIINGSTMLPLRAIGDAASCDVSWNAGTKTVSITPKAPALVEDDAVAVRKVSWTTLRDTELSFTYTISKAGYEYYSQLPRYYSPKQYQNYVSDSNNEDVIKVFADKLREFGQTHNYTDSEVAMEAIRLVQSIPYVSDPESRNAEEYPKYPIETLYERCGDCEDVSILLVAILRELGYGTAFIHVPGHIAVGILGAEGLPGSYFELDGKRYYYVEATAEGWNIGDYPDSNPKSAEIIVVH